jgi:hypothetical protein
MHDLGIRRVSAKFFPQLPMQEQTTACCDYCNLLKMKPPFLPGIITADETWVHGYDPERKM